MFGDKILLITGGTGSFGNPECMTKVLPFHVISAMHKD